MIPLLINSSEPMRKVRVVTVKDQSEEALRRLQALGVLHVEEAQELDPVDREAIEGEKNRIRTALNSLDFVLDFLSEERSVLIPVTSPLTLDEILERTEVIHSRISSLVERYNRTRGETARLQELGRCLKILAREMAVPLQDLHYSGTYVFTNVVALSEETYKIFSEKALPLTLQHHAVHGDGDVVVYFVARTDMRKEIETIARDLGTTPLIIPDEAVSLRDFINRNEEAVASHRDSLQVMEKEIETAVEGELQDIALYRETLSEEDERLSVLQHACEARYVTLVEGWVPESASQSITEELKKELQYAFIDSMTPSAGDEPPTKLRNPRGIKPFEVIVRLFSLPKYGDWDPTPSVAYFFAFFFGLMLNDMVYALGLLFLARFVLDKLVDDPSSEGTQLFRKVLYISGSVALILGVLSGTYLGDFMSMYFGIDLKMLALVQTIQAQLSDPISFIILSLIIGLVHLNIAHMLGLVRGLKQGDRGIVVSKIGLFLIQIFGIPYLFKSMLNIALFSLSDAAYAACAYPLAAGLLLVIVGAFMQMGALGSVFWIFDLTGILGDVMSYSRLAGVGLATFYLASSFNLLSDWVSATVSSVIPGFIGIAIATLVGIALLVMFHVFNLFLSSLAAFIHSLRLCFVEFLLKFYEGGGREYEPFHLRVRREVIIGKKS